MARARPTLRLFVALYPPPDVARQFLAAAGAIDLPPHRMTPQHQAHITVQFIGDTPVTRIAETIESTERAASGLPAMLVKPERLIRLPERGPARLVAAETDAPAPMRELQRRLVVRFARKVREKQRRFRPHVTLCRFRTPTADVRVDERLVVDPFPVDAVFLMKSVLHPHGAEHEEVARVTLAGA